MDTRVDKWKCEVRKVGWIVWKNETMVHRELKRGGEGLMVFKLVGLGAGWIFPSYVSILLFIESSTEARPMFLFSRVITHWSARTWWFGM